MTNCNFTGNNLGIRAGSAQGFYEYGHGGAITWSSNNGIISHCNFNNNNVNLPVSPYLHGYEVYDSNGGAIYLNGGNINNCNFTSNGAPVYGGAIFLANNGNITNCIFTTNHANLGGGAIYLANEGNINYSNFTKNSISSRQDISGKGGALYIVSGNVDNSNFDYNKAELHNGHYYQQSGGAIYIVNGNVTNSNFTNNRAYLNGGAIYRAGNGNGNVTNSNFTNNRATTGNGGAIYFTGSGNVTNSDFTNNKGSDGGAVYSSGNGTITNSNFTGNTATNGGAVRLTGNGTITNSNFTGNTATNGGAVRLDGSGNISYSNFIGNSASNGGAIYTVNGNVINSNFTKNRGTGAAIYGIRGVVKDSVFIDNKAGSRLTITSVDLLKTVTLNGNENYINAIYSSGASFDNVTYYWDGAVVNSDDVTPVKSTQEVGFNITIELYNNNNILLDNVTLVTDSNGQVVYSYDKYAPNENYRIKAYHLEDNYYTYSTTGTSFRTPTLYNVIVLNNDTCYILENNSTKLNATIKNSQNNKTINPSSLTYNIISDSGYSSSKIVFVGKNDIPITVKYSWGDDYGDDWYNVAFENAKLYVTVDYMNEYEFDAYEKEGEYSFTIP